MSGSIEQNESTDVTTGNELVELADGGGSGNKATVTASNALKVDGSAVTQPVSAASLPLPTGAATAANQSTEITSLQVIDNPVGSPTGGTAGTSSFLSGAIYTSTTGLTTPLTTGQQAALQVDVNGRLLISPSSEGVPDKTTFTYGTTSELVVGGVYQDTSPTLSSGTSGALRLNINRAQHVTLRDPTTDVGITSDSNGTASDQRLHTATPDTTTTSTALGALNATVQIAMAGMASVGFQLTTGTLIGTLVAECSIDGGTTWTQCEFYNPASSSSASSIVFSSANTITVLSILPIGGSSHARARVSAYTSGTANAVMRASEVTGPVVNTSITLPTTASKFAFGRVTTAATTQAPVEETTYTEQTTNGQRSLSSSNAGDISGGTGARTVLITYYDQTGAGPFTETVTMAGTATANTVGTNICYIESLKVTSVGSAGSNQGTITLFTAINKGGTTIGTIAVGDTETFWTHHYVPLGKICYVSGFSVGNNATSAGAGGLFVLKAATPVVANSQELQASDFVTIAGGQNTDTRVYISPIQVPGPARIRAYVTPYATSSTTQYASFDFIDN